MATACGKPQAYTLELRAERLYLLGGEVWVMGEGGAQPVLRDGALIPKAERERRGVSGYPIAGGRLTGASTPSPGPGGDTFPQYNPSAVVVAEQYAGDHHRIHVVERLALQTAYPQVAERLAAIYNYVVLNLSERIFEADQRADLYTHPSSRPPPDLKARENVYVMVDATGCGLPVVDFLRESAGIPDRHLTGVMFTAGTGCNVHRGAKDGTVAKSYLVSRLQSLIGFGRIEWPRTPAADQLVDELKTFELSINDNATPQWNARAGHHDDLVCAAALAVLMEGGAHACGVYRYA